jgi:hypothetical protein
MKFKTLIAAVALCVTAFAISGATARDNDPSSEEINEFASFYMKLGQKNKLSDREIANSLASEIIWLEKIQVICPSYYYVNARRARFEYLVRQGTWAMLFGPGRSSTEIMNAASAKRNQEFNNSLSKKNWCEDIKAFGMKHFGWGPIFEANQ